MGKMVPARNGGSIYKADKGEVMNPNGRGKGVKNRSTIAKKILEMANVMPNEIYDKLKSFYPKIEKMMTVEEVMSIIQAHKAIIESDTNAYKALLDSAYGAPKQEIEQSSPITINLSNPKEPKSNDNI